MQRGRHNSEIVASAEEKELRQCKRCLLRDGPDEEYYQSILEYIASLPEAEKADEGLYKERLCRCTACDALINGMCRLCGCFVEVRAAKLRQHCAKSSEIW